MAKAMDPKMSDFDADVKTIISTVMVLNITLNLIFFLNWSQFQLELEEESSELSSLSDECYRFEQNDLSANCFPIFDELRRQQKLCDISVKVIEFSLKTVTQSKSVPILKTF